MGTLVRSGRGEGVVVGTGTQSEFGVVFSMMQEVRCPPFSACSSDLGRGWSHVFGYSRARPRTQVGDKKTPLQVAMDELAKRLSAISFGVIGVICLIGVLQKRSWLEMFTIGGASPPSASLWRGSRSRAARSRTVSLAVAAIPEGLPIVVTVTLALGVLRMSKRSAIVKKLPSVETLGSVSVICSDKTGALDGSRSSPGHRLAARSLCRSLAGTLTTNVMTVTKAYSVDHGVFDLDHSPPLLALDDARAKVFLVGNLCNHAHADKGKYHGQATEVALMNALSAVGLSDQRPFFTRKGEVAFSSETKSQSVTGAFSHAPAGTPDMTYLSGALEPVVARCRTYLRADGTAAPLDPGVAKLVASKAHELSAQGLRVVSMAYGTDQDALTFAGFQGMMDPPRAGVADAISMLAAGGIHVVMITGDSEPTAVAIARQLGIRTTARGGGAGGGAASRAGVLTGKEIDLLSQRQLADRIGSVTVFARTTPRHKMAIIEAYQSRGAVVAMTGDGGAPFVVSSRSWVPGVT